MNSPASPASRPPLLIRPRLSLALRWTARVSAALLVVFWGAFFVSHLSEWFIAPAVSWPPPGVWVAMALHGAMILGLLTLLRWELFGAALTTIATLGFYLAIAPPTGARSPVIVLISLIPAALAFVAHALKRK